MFGIEAFPGIQTIAHMEKYLRFEAAGPVRDMMRCMMLCSEETYILIDTMLGYLATCFRSRRIWLGMDEGWNVCRGDYFTLNRNSKDPKMPTELVAEHTKKVIELAHKYNWNSRLCGTTLRYHNALDAMVDFRPFDDAVFPVGSYNGDLSEDEFVRIMNAYAPLKNKKAFIGGIQTWYGFAPEYNFSLGNVRSILPLCKKYGVDEVYGTIWMNDGSECDFFLTLLAAQAYAEHMYNKEVSDEQIKDMFEFVSGTSYDAFGDLSYFHNKKMTDKGLLEANGINFWGKKYFWADPMMGLFDYHLYKNPMSTHYGEMRDKYTEYKKHGNPFFIKRYEFFEQVFDMLSLKYYIAENLKPAYVDGNKAFLAEAAKELLPSLGKKVEALRKMHRELWLDVCKPFGQEVLDARYGALVSRCDSSIYRISEYLDGKLDSLPELEEERLEKNLAYNAMYYGISSASNVSTGMV